jgi:S1-C subfamily serine protease
MEVVILNRANLGVSSMASGFVAHHKDWIITNYHANANANSIFEPDEHTVHIVAPNEDKLIVQVLPIDIHNDLAILKVEKDVPESLLELKETLPNRGEPGFSMGKPGGYEHSIVTGTFNGSTSKSTTPLILLQRCIIEFCSLHHSEAGGRT